MALHAAAGSFAAIASLSRLKAARQPYLTAEHYVYSMRSSFNGVYYLTNLVDESEQAEALRTAESS